MEVMKSKWSKIRVKNRRGWLLSKPSLVEKYTNNYTELPASKRRTVSFETLRTLIETPWSLEFTQKACFKHRKLSG